MKSHKNKTRILIINTVGMGYEGMSNVILNYLGNMCLDGLELHFTATNDVCEDVRNKLDNLGSIHYVPLKKENLKGYICKLNQILKNKFDVIHIHGNSGTMAIETLLAKLHSVPQIIVHCHNTRCSYPVINQILTPFMKLLATDLIACSAASGKWLYHNSKYLVLNNAIDLRKFAFNDSIRKKVREEFRIKDKLVVGHIGGFIEAKNHQYLLEVFSEFHKQYPYSKLMLVGDGPDFDAVVKQVTQLRIQSAVIFTGRRKDTDRLYQAMDIFVMPSRWEGLPLVLLEAQASGLPVIASDRITRDVQCTQNVWFMSITEPPSVWAMKLAELTERNINRTANVEEQFRQNGFDISKEADKLRALYKK